MFQPLNRMVLMKPEYVEKIGLIFVPDSAKQTPMYATVVAVGPGELTKTGVRVPLEVKPKDRVALRHYFSNAIEIHGEKFILCPEEEIVGIIE